MSKVGLVREGAVPVHLDLSTSRLEHVRAPRIMINSSSVCFVNLGGKKIA